MDAEDFEVLSTVLLDFSPQSQAESHNHDYSFLALVRVEDTANFRVMVLNAGFRVIHIADALLQDKVKKNVVLYFPVDERLPGLVEELKLEPRRAMHLHAAHVNLEWQKIHTEQFEPRLRRCVQSQLDACLAGKMFNPTLQLEGAYENMKPYNVQDDIMVERGQRGTSIVFTVRVFEEHCWKLLGSVNF